MMDDTLIIQKAIDEIETKNFGVTAQFLEIHQFVYENGKPKILRVDRERTDGTAIVYLEVKDEQFHVVIFLDTIPKVKVKWVGIEPYNSVYLSVVSETLSLQQLSAMTKLKPTGGRSKGDKRGHVFWKRSKFMFEPNPEPDEFEDKLKKLLDLLEHDREGVNQLTTNAITCIQVAQEFHNGNTMLGGSYIPKESIQRIAALNLSIDFDLYVSGNFFK